MMDVSRLIPALFVGLVGMNVVLVILGIKYLEQDKQNGVSKKKKVVFCLTNAFLFLMSLLLGHLFSQQKMFFVIAALPTIIFFLYLYFDGEKK